MEPPSLPYARGSPADQEDPAELQKCETSETGMHAFKLLIIMINTMMMMIIIINNSHSSHIKGRVLLTLGPGRPLKPSEPGSPRKPFTPGRPGLPLVPGRPGGPSNPEKSPPEHLQSPGSPAGRRD